MRESHVELSSEAKIIHSEYKDSGKSFIFRTLYKSASKTFNSIIEINKENQNIIESDFNEVVEVPIASNYITNYEAQSVVLTKLDANDLSANIYFTVAYNYIQSIYTDELTGAQLNGASQQV